MEPKEDVSDSPEGWVADHIRGYVESEGEEGHDYYGHQTLLLTTRGRKSGLLRRTALIYRPHGDAFVVAGSNGGAEAHPAWYLNLVAEPRVTVQVRARTFSALARTASAEERPALWRQVAEAFPQYDEFQKHLTREIPVVLLEPVPA